MPIAQTSAINSREISRRPVDYEKIKLEAMTCLHSLVKCWLPDGRQEGDEWVALNPRRNDRRLGSFKVNLRTGCWSDFATGDAGGDPISLAAYLFGLSQSDAARRLVLKLGLRAAGSNPELGSTAMTDDPFTPLAAEELYPMGASSRPIFEGTDQKIDLARQRWNDCVSIAGTVAERYLVEHRKLDPPADDGPLRCHQCFSTRREMAGRPALVALVTDDLGMIVGIQAVLLDLGTANKANCRTPKISLGKVGKGTVRLGDPRSKVLCLAEGIETALSRLVAGSVDLRVSLGALRYQPLASHQDTVEIIVDRGAEKPAQRLVERYSLQGTRVRLVEMPASLAGDKVDLNDLLCTEGGREAVVLAVQGAQAAVPSSVPDASRPEIHLIGGTLDRTVAKAEEILAQADVEQPQHRVYQRSRSLVLLHRDPTAATEEASGRPSYSIVDLSCEDLRCRLTRNAVWLKYPRGGGDPYPVDVPKEVAQSLLHSPTVWRNLPVLRGVISGPTFRRDGSVVDQPGFDELSGQFADFDPSHFPEIPKEPTREQALAALELLKGVYQHFPFEDEADLAIQLSAVLTASVRHLLRAAPMFAFSAPKMGSGKSLLATTVSYIALGTAPAMMSQINDDESERKRVFSLLRGGARIVVIDNIERPLQSHVLCSVLTEPRFKDRVLGLSRDEEVSTDATFLATGNNLVVSGDLTTRVLMARLDPQCEQPEQRSFEVNLHKYVPEHRGELLVAALTIIRSYRCAGSPDLGLTPFGRFEDWSEWCRAPLVWLCLADPCSTRHRIEEEDPVREQLRVFLRALYALTNGSTLTTKAIITHSVPNGNDDQELLREIINEVSGGSHGISRGRLGRWLASQVGRIEDGYRLERCGKKQNAQLWRVMKLQHLG